ncbi:glutaminase [Marinoscillum furvescens]|uniref:Glutaminase n=1 Tax=Marinoscillum furvescens DSM 4134 TaxID=1122208 RepID=A0A3D9LKN9_MARFU|nr:glutaminase [Marinoscillum furvescens]REE05822.1 L-glutaminase [Marinoscillum furvescens DSM 4134]
MNYQQVIESVFEAVAKENLRGKLADYIPELARVNHELFGVCLVDRQGNTYQYGDSQTAFSIQSISKAHTLTMVYSDLAADLWKRVNVEPSGNPFNNLAQLEYENGIPRNPFINSGALVTTDALMSMHAEPKEAIHQFIKGMTGGEDVSANKAVQESELECADRNRAVAHLLKSYNNLHNDVEELMEVYTYHCALEMNCEQLAKSFLYLANHGHCIYTNRQVLDRGLTKRINALMLTCGFYDEAGEFAFKVGLAGKSGVGGGVIAVLPGEFSIAVYSPELNEKGNPVKALRFLELLTTDMGISLF